MSALDDFLEHFQKRLADMSGGKVQLQFERLTPEQRAQLNQALGMKDEDDALDVSGIPELRIAAQAGGDGETGGVALIDIDANGNKYLARMTLHSALCLLISLRFALGQSARNTPESFRQAANGIGCTCDICREIHRLAEEILAEVAAPAPRRAPVRAPYVCLSCGVRVVDGGACPVCGEGGAR